MGTSSSTLYLSMKYMLLDGKIIVIQGDREIGKKSYTVSFKLKIVQTLGVNTRKVGSRINPLEETRQGKEVPPQKRKKIRG